MTIATKDNARSEIDALIKSWMDAVRRKDLDLLGSCYDPDVIAFDAVQQLQFTGWPAYAAHWKQCLGACDGTLNMSVRDLKIQVREDLAVVFGLVRCGMEGQNESGSTHCRMTMILQRGDAHWQIVHEHFSFAIDMLTGRAMYELKPDGAGQTRTVNPIPFGMSTVTAHLVCAGASKAIDLYIRAFGAVEHSRLETPDGAVMHAYLRIGDSAVFISDEFPNCGSSGPTKLGGTPVTLHLYVADVDAAMTKAVEAGCSCLMPAQDMFWGDRYGQVQDPYGHRWSIATHKRDLTTEQIAEGAREMRAQMA